MLRCIAVDDEPLALELMKDYISKMPYLHLVATCNDGMEANKVLSQESIDLAFMDIQMPGITGLQLIQSINQKPLFILVTAYDEFALEGYRLNVIDYLLKPVEFPRFVQACNKAVELHKLMNEQLPYSKDFIFVPVEYSMVKVLFKDILWLESVKDYTRVHLKSPAKPLLVRMSMKNAEDELPASLFIRIHKSFLVAINAISSVRKNSVFIDTHELPVGETFKPFLEVLMNKK